VEFWLSARNGVQIRSCTDGLRVNSLSTLSTRRILHVAAVWTSVREYVFYVFFRFKKNMTFYVFLNDLSKKRKKSLNDSKLLDVMGTYRPRPRPFSHTAICKLHSFLCQHF